MWQLFGSITDKIRSVVQHLAVDTTGDWRGVERADSTDLSPIVEYWKHQIVVERQSIEAI